MAYLVLVSPLICYIRKQMYSRKVNSFQYYIKSTGGKESDKETLCCIFCHSSVLQYINSIPKIWETEIQFSPEICSYSKMVDQLSDKIYSEVHDALCGSKEGLFSFHLNWKFTGTDGWYMIQLLHAEGADNTRDACGATALFLSLQCHSCPVCLAGCSSIVPKTEEVPSRRNQRRLNSDYYSTVWKVLDSLESFASGKFEEGLRRTASWECQWTHLCLLKDYRNYWDIKGKELCSHPCSIRAAFFLSKWEVGVDTSYLTPWQLIWCLGVFGLFALF